MSQLANLTSQCIRCGFCLEACPTFLETGEETESPRGRIYLVRSAEEGTIAWEDARMPLDLCLGCRACETACPSAVTYGEILELARDRLERRPGFSPKRILLNVLARPSKLRRQLAFSKFLPGRRVPWIVSKLLSGQPPEADRPELPSEIRFPPFEESDLPPLKGEAAVLEGCAMRVLYPHVNEITRRLLRRVGYLAREFEQECCGALHAHNGNLESAKAMRETLFSALPQGLPLIVNSAGCGSWLKESARHGRVYDASEFLLEHGLAEHLSQKGHLESVVTYHDACHLAHGQGIRMEPRALLKAIPGIQMVELNEADTCCGSGGIYNILQPRMARRLLERKWVNIERTGATIAATGNPGCHAWIAQAAKEHGETVEVLHTLEVLERALSG
ncbi:MAG: (Fe-S)-binding protein [Fimbriimonadaceae bacterium]|nr:(Fe-S)-binding protein [Fimbriimonadaceae bacterium]